MIAVFIHPSVKASLGERLEISQGIGPAEAIAGYQVPFRPGALLARPPWRRLSPAECVRFEKASPLPDSRKVGLFNLGASTIQPFAEAGLHDNLAIERIAELKTRAPACVAWLGLGAQLRPFVESRGMGHWETLLPRRPGLAASTEDPVGSGLFAGLHVDSWFPKPVGQRHLSPGRLCVNLGAEDRFFLFAPYTVTDIYSWSSRPRRGGIDTLLSGLLAQSPDLPILRLRVRPGEAYIAPTENLIHDGSTVGQTKVDLTATWKGRWDLSRAF